MNDLPHMGGSDIISAWPMTMDEDWYPEADQAEDDSSRLRALGHQSTGEKVSIVLL